MRNIFLFLFLIISLFYEAQKTVVPPKNLAKSKKVSKFTMSPKNLDLVKVNDSIPALIPKKFENKYGFVNQQSKLIILPEYSNVGFFTQDCALLNSPNIKVRKFGSPKYSSVRLNGEDFRINEAGKRVYKFKDKDLGKCNSELKAQLFHGYILNNNYGIIEDSRFHNPADYTQFSIYPQYDYLHILEGDDLKNPMIIAVRDNKFGIINTKNQIIIPFEYSDIKRNYSWKLARLFEVTEDGKNYYFIDSDQKKY